MMRNKNAAFFTLLIILCAGCTKTKLTDAGEAATLAPAANTGATLKTMVSPVGDVVGKLVVGYQGWFDCVGSGSPMNSWVHWASGVPAPANVTFELYPDVREYTSTYATGLGALGNGQPSKLYSSWTPQTINKNFEWMQTYGIDCAALQRFGSMTTPGSALKNYADAIATAVKNASQTYGRKFYIMYDCSATTAVDVDWTTTMSALTSSTAYAKQNGKPVVCLWGVGFTGRGSAADWLTKINWFKSQGCYVIIGVVRNFATLTTYTSAFDAADMLSPWTVGSYKGVTGATNYATNLAADLTYCNGKGQDYQPVIWPGFAWSNWNGGAQNDFPRVHGDFMWQQFYNLRNLGLTNPYVAMFNEYDEGTAIAKAAEDVSMKPNNQYFLTLDADGVACSSDFYLRLTGDGAKMVKGLTPLVSTHPTVHMFYFDNCDATTGWGSGGTLSLNTADKKEGTGSLQSVGSATNEFQKVFTAYNSGATEANGSIRFWYYVSDITKFSASNQIEIGSGGVNDVNEYSWNIGTLVNGWNLIEKPFNTAGKIGTPNLSALNWFRIYHAKTASITTKVDAIRIVTR